MFRPASLAVAVLVTAGCTAGADDGRTTVVTAGYPYAFVAERVGGGGVDVVDLLGAGVEPHGLELTPRQVAQVGEADLVAYDSGFQPAIDDAVEQADGTEALDVGALPGFSAPGAAARDPHLWLDPAQLSRVVDAVAGRLARIDPSQAAVFRDNAQRLSAELRRLDRDYRRGLADCVRDVIVTSHAAFGHLADRYGLRMVAIAGQDPHAEPTAEGQASIVETIRAQRVTTIFTEPLASPDVAEALAADTGATVAILDPIEVRTEEGAGYFPRMRANLAALRRANGCR